MKYSLIEEKHIERRINEIDLNIKALHYDTQKIKHNPKSKIETLILKLEDLQETLIEQKIETVNERIKILNIITYLPDGIIKQIFELRYYDCYSWDKISNIVYLSNKQCYRYINKGLDYLVTIPEIQNIIMEYENEE